MEDVLEVYRRPYDPERPQVCIDETSKQLLEHTRIPIPASPGTPARVDDEYKRCGTANIFLCVEPLTGETVVKATERRTKTDFAHFIRDLCDGPYRDADKVIVVMDNLNTHSPASLYEAFPPAEARRLIEKLEIHHTPKHGSWLDIAEIQLSVLARQCLHQRIDSMVGLKKSSKPGKNDTTRRRTPSPGGSPRRTHGSSCDVFTRFGRLEALLER